MRWDPVMASGGALMAPVAHQRILFGGIPLRGILARVGRRLEPCVKLGPATYSRGRQVGRELGVAEVVR